MGKKRKSGGKPTKKSKSSGKSKKRVGIGSKKKKPTAPVRFRGKFLDEKLTDFVKDVRRKLLLKGCFYSYKRIVELLMRHVWWHIFLKRNPVNLYPCDKKFQDIVTPLIYFEEDDYYKNSVISQKDAIMDRYAGSKFRMFLRGFNNKIKRYKDPVKYQEDIDYWLSMIWDGTEAVSYTHLTLPTKA